MVRIDSNCSPEMLIWARERAGYTIEAAAATLRIDVGQLDEWEHGVSLPSYSQLEKIANKYRRPTMVFYLEEPPRNFQVVRDLRTTAARRFAGEFEFTPAASYALRIAEEKQAWAKEILERDESDLLSFVNSMSREDYPTAVAARIRDLLGFTLRSQIESGTPGQSFRQWKQCIENAGIFAFQFNRVEIEEMRGFAIADPIAPVIAVNAKDSYPARTFSLIHEVAHILIGVSAVSDLSKANTIDIERFCERVAAEVLMPREDFLASIPGGWEGRIEAVAGVLAKRYKCSKSAVLYRFVDLEMMSAQEVYEIVRFYRAKDEEVVEKRDFKIKQQTLAVSRNGRYFAQLAVSAFWSGAIHGGQLSGLLGMKLNHLPGLEKLLGASNG